MLDIIQYFPFIFLLYCGSHEHVYIYINPICNVVVSFSYCVDPMSMYIYIYIYI